MMRKAFLLRNLIKLETNLLKSSTSFKQFSLSVTSRKNDMGSTSSSASSTNNSNPESSINENEMVKFQKLSQLWWQVNGPFEALHRFNTLRIPWIRNTLLNSYLKTSDNQNLTEPLNGMYILDVGCGGGLISEPLARLGAQITAIDMVRDNIVIAENHLNSYLPGTSDYKLIDRIQYVNCTLEDLTLSDQNNEFFDAIVMSEVVEHVDNLDVLIKNSSKLLKVLLFLKNNGFIFITTLNRTYASYLFGILVAENVLGIVDPGTHDWNKFVPPNDIKNLLEKNNLLPQQEMGILYNPLTKNWSWISSTQINYAITAQKLVLQPNVDV